MPVMEIWIVVFYLFMVSPRDHLVPISHYRPTAQLMKDKDRSKLIYSHQSYD